VRYLVTGAAGFIGYHVADRLLARGDEVAGLDDRNPYYDVRLKDARLARLTGRPGFRFHALGLGDRDGVERAFAETRPDIVIHLAAQAGVRHSISHPHAYVESNLTGFLHVLEGCRTEGVKHLVYASSSSVYGASTQVPYDEHQEASHPVSFYAATKRAGELMAHSYSHLFGLPSTGVRLFTVYGPWGRPDMMYFTFARDILAGRPIRLFNNGQMRRDFTYVDDVVESLLRVADHPAAADPAWRPEEPTAGTSSAPWRILNIGAGRPHDLATFLDALEGALGRTANREYTALEPGDVVTTWASVDALERLTGFRPATPLEVGVGRFVEWYRWYHGEEGDDAGGVAPR
jgi:UDP-glucuronate 4-epimerase